MADSITDALPIGLALTSELNEWIKRSRIVAVRSINPSRTGRKTILLTDDAGNEFYLKQRPFPFGAHETPHQVSDFFPTVVLRSDATSVTIEEAVQGRQPSDSPEDLQAVAELLASFHEATAETNRQFAELLVERMLKMLVSLRMQGNGSGEFPVSALWRSSITPWPRRLPVTWIHGDMKPQHMVIGPERGWLLERSSLREGFAFEDVACMVNWLAWRHGEESAAVQTFVNAYCALQPIPPQLLNLGRICGILQIIRERDFDEGQEDEHAMAALDTLQRLVGVMLQDKTPRGPEIVLPDEPVEQYHLNRPNQIAASLSSSASLQWSNKQRRWVKRSALDDGYLNVHAGVFQKDFWSQQIGRNLKAVEPIAYRQERHLTMRLVEDEGERTSILHLYAPHVFHSCERSLRLWQQVQEQVKGLAHIQRLIPDAYSVFMDDLPGITPDLSDAQVLGALYEIQGRMLSLKDPGNSPVMSSGGFVGEIVEQLSRMSNFTEVWPKRALDWFWRELETLQSPPAMHSLVLSHGCMRQDRLLWNDSSQELHLLHPDAMCMAPAGFDTAALIGSVSVEESTDIQAAQALQQSIVGNNASAEKGLRMYLPLWIIRLALRRLRRQPSLSTSAEWFNHLRQAIAKP